jgi:hypothetical protein
MVRNKDTTKKKRSEGNEGMKRMGNNKKNSKGSNG